MTSVDVPTGPPLPSPAAALQARFEHILQHQMAGVPMLNPALQVQALGFRPWAGHWLGVLVTPWFMNLVLFPRQREQWQAIGERESRHYVFPAGVFEFIGSHDGELGDYQACSLFSPMFEFQDHAAAHDTAVAALAALFDPALRPVSDAPAATDEPRAEAMPSAPAKPALSKRDFLFGGNARGPREP
ncbi:MAG: [NiFe]-hydrogenase assembly chaperone HybE [Rubrivivax sp.]|nr:[NiFe]-hydrogenase assembly chaperone HybE [Rubrivivax sp.]